MVKAAGDPEAVRGEHLTEAALDGDPEALVVIKEFAWWLAVGLANLCNVLDPSVIVLGGGLIEAEQAVMGPLRDAFADLVEAPGARRVKIVPARLGEKAGAVGAALLAAQQTGMTARPRQSGVAPIMQALDFAGRVPSLRRMSICQLPRTGSCPFPGSERPHRPGSPRSNTGRRARGSPKAGAGGAWHG